MSIGKEIDRLYDYLEDQLLLGKYKDVSLFLKYFDLLNTAPEISIAVLSITRICRRKLTHRKSFFKRLKGYLQRIEGFEEAEKTLHGLE